MAKACIIGVSGYGRVHYDLLTAEQAAGNVEIVGATIINQDEEQEKCAYLRSIGCRIFDDYTAMLDELSGSADLCMIPTGTPLHRPMTVAALGAGMNVLVEKPVAGCLADAKLMQQAAEQAGKTVAVGYQHMYAPSTMPAKRRLLDGLIGDLEMIKCMVIWPRDHAYYKRNSWAGRLTAGDAAVNDSPYNNAVAHELMMMLFLAGTAERQAARPVSVEAELYRVNPIESPDTACMRIETDTGVPICFYPTHAGRSHVNPKIIIRGTRGQLSMTHKRVQIRTAAGETLEFESGGGNAERTEMMDAVLDAIRGGSSFYCDLDLAARQTMVVDAIHRACTIHPVDGESIPWDNGAVQTILPGLDEIMRTAFENEELFHATGAAWSCPAEQTRIREAD